MIRALLVPSLMRLMGKWNWWLPPWAARVLRVSPAPPDGRQAGEYPAVRESFDAGDFDRAVALIGAEPSPRKLVEGLGLDWEHLEWLSLNASASVLGELSEQRGVVVSYGGEAFTAGFLIGVHLVAEPRPAPERLAAAVDLVQVRGRHAVIADHCDLASVARLETLYAAALVESMPLDEPERPKLLPPVTRVFEAGLAVGVEVGSGRGERNPAPQEP